MDTGLGQFSRTLANILTKTKALRGSAFVTENINSLKSGVFRILGLSGTSSNRIASKIIGNDTDPATISLELNHSV